MPGLSRDLVEHRLPIKAGFRPYKQLVRRFNPIIYDRIKTEINHLLDAIRVERKNSKIKFGLTCKFCISSTL